MQPFRRPQAPTRAGLQAWMLALGVATLGGLVWFGSRRGAWFGGAAEAAPAGAEVRRGTLHIAITSRGNLAAADAVSLKSEVEGRTTILSLVPEGTQVQAGELVCELDATALIERRFQQSLAVSNAEAALVKARQNHEIQVSQNKSDIARAQQKLTFAAQDVKKYAEGERDFERQKAQQAIDIAKEEAARAADKLTWSEKLAGQGFLTSSELDADRVAAHRAAVALEQAQRTLDLLDQFQLPRKADELQAALEEAQREEERVELQAKARLVDFAAEVSTNQARFGLEQEKLAQLEAQIAKAKLRAPRAGLLVYAQRDSDDPPIQEGTEVREREEIMSIPNAGGMIAEAKLHETVVKQVQIGQLCRIKVDALPGAEFEGRVGFISVLPDQTSRWMNPNTRLYRTEVEINGGTGDMRPGMSCAIEIQIEDLTDALHVPVQAVSRVREEDVCYVPHGDTFERRVVEVGRYNDQWVQILSGLKEGEIVLMSPPPGAEVAPATQLERPEPAPPAAAGA